MDDPILRTRADELPGSSTSFNDLTRLRGRRARWERLSIVIGSVVVLALAAGGLWAAFRPAGPEVSTEPAAGGPGDVVAIPPLADGQYLYRDLSFFLAQGSPEPYRMKVWARADGAGRLVYKPPEGSMYGMPIEKGGYGQDDPADASYGPNETPFPLIEISADPAEALAQLRARGEPGGASPGPAPIDDPRPGDSVENLKLLRVMRDLLTDDAAMVASPQAQQGIYAVMRSMPEVEAVDGTADPVGREAIALAYAVHDRVDTVFYFDPTTHLLLASAGFDGAGHPYDVRVIQALGYASSLEPSSPEESFIPTTTEAEATATWQQLAPPPRAGGPGGVSPTTD